ncbi:AMIN domain-containing protein [Mastigocladopsis repens]|uniref:AMIN domain-containing protein n=1 Tax=Mastigocladopsis repens TaxID=221287 RepID=UPI0002DE770B|nr:AMIN domain-containing protein [Mastigocladopsis repens]
MPNLVPSDTFGRSGKQKKQLSWTIVDEFCGAVRSMDKQLRNRQFFQFCKHLFRVSLFGLYAVMLYGKPLTVYALETDNSSNNSGVAPVAILEDWRFYPQELQLEISLSAALQPRSFYLAQPSRIVVDLPSTKLGNIPTLQNFSGAVQSIRVSQFNADVTRIVMDLAPGTFIDPTSVQLQPVSRENPNRWVLRPLVDSDRTSLPQRNLPSLPSNFSPTTITPPLPANTPSGSYNPPQYPANLPSGSYNPPQYPANLPSGSYNPPQYPGNLPSATYNPPQPPANLPSGSYNPPQYPGNLPSATYNPPQYPANLPSGSYNPPQYPPNLPSGSYNPPQPSGNLPSATYNSPQVPNFSVPPPLTTLPPTTSNFPQTPSVQVPPFTPNNPSQQPGSILPSPAFPYQPGHLNNSIPSVSTPNSPVPSAPSYQPSSPNSRVIEFGQPFPNPSR